MCDLMRFVDLSYGWNINLEFFSLLSRFCKSQNFGDISIKKIVPVGKNQSSGQVVIAQQLSMRHSIMRWSVLYRRESTKYSNPPLRNWETTSIIGEFHTALIYLCSSRTALKQSLLWDSPENLRNNAPFNKKLLLTNSHKKKLAKNW